MPKGKRRTVAQQLADEAKVAEIMLEQPGISQSKIAEIIGVSQPTISRHKVSLFRRWVENAQDHFTEMMLGQLRRSQWRYDEAMDAWEASKEPVTEKKTEGGRGMPSKASVTTKERDGAATFLEIMRKEDEYQAKLLGLLKDKVDVTSNGRTIGLSADVLASADERAAEELDDWQRARFGKENTVKH